MKSDSVDASKLDGADAAAIASKTRLVRTNTPILATQMPAGSVVKSVYAEYIANANLTAVIPRADAIPQDSAGTEILSVTITPDSTTNALRCRFTGWGSKSTVGTVIAALFAKGTGISGTPTDARQVVPATIDVADYARPLAMEVFFVPGTTNTVTISVRVGPDATGGIARLNGTSSNRFYGGRSAGHSHCRRNQGWLKMGISQMLRKCSRVLRSIRDI